MTGGGYHVWVLTHDSSDPEVEGPWIHFIYFYSADERKGALAIQYV